MRLDHNADILEHIISYCDQIEQTVVRFGNSYDTFYTDAIYRNAAALCILQIGELVGKLTEDFRSSHDAIPWRKIKATACRKNLKKPSEVGPVSWFWKEFQ